MATSQFDYSTYLSPFTWRYGSDKMRSIWSEENKRKLWRKIWVALARAQQKSGLLTKKELLDLEKYQDKIDIEKAHEIEKEIHHDLMAEIKTFASQAKIGGGKIHLGATSMDIEDNTDTIRAKESLEIIEEKTKRLLGEFAKKIAEYKDLPCMAYTHLQPAEPTTLGYRFALYAQDIVFDLRFLAFVKKELRAKGLKGAVGTSASYEKLLDKEKAERMEKDVMKELGLSEVLISGQTGPRKLDMFVADFLSSLAQSLYKFAFDLRIMQSPGFGELQEPFGKKQVGSSAMPFKRNPWKSEQLCSFARLVFHLAQVARDNAAHMLLERTLDDSANRRAYIPEMFLSVDEMLESATKIVSGLVVHEKQIEKNLMMHGPFSATEAILMECVKRGGDRQKLHEVLREHAISSYKEIQETGNNPLQKLLADDTRITSFIAKSDVGKLLNPKTHTGLAAKKCTQFLKLIKDDLSS